MADFVIGSLVEAALGTPAWSIPVLRDIPTHLSAYCDRSGLPNTIYMVVDTAPFHAKILVIKTLELWWVDNKYLMDYDCPLRIQ